jgi:hypothetical protein
MSNSAPKMNIKVGLDDIPTIGELPPRKMAAKLRRMGDPETADEILANLRGHQDKSQLFGLGPLPAWKHSNHQYGYIKQLAPGSATPQPIQYAGVVDADLGLANNRIDIHFDRLHVHQYPGSGEHNILFTFKAQNQIPNAPEPVSFNQAYAVRDGETAAEIGRPVFIGLGVGSLGAGFELSTVNIRSSNDQAILDVLQSAPFASGLNLLTTVQPVMKPFTDITLGIARMFATRNDNAKVQKVYLGLDFDPSAIGVRLAQGNYIVVQVPTENAINWNDWLFDPVTESILNKNDMVTTLLYNYLIFRVTKHKE